jgi:hypothetical protein
MSKSKLPFQVECKSIFAFFEPIAAFDHIKVAHRYAQDCLQTNPKFEYRLRDLENGKTYAVSAYRGWGEVA